MGDFLNYLNFAKYGMIFSKNSFYVGYLQDNVYDDNFSFFDKNNSEKNSNTKYLKTRILQDEFNKKDYIENFYYDGFIKVKSYQKFACSSYKDKIILIKTSDENNFKTILNAHKINIVFYFLLFILNGFFIDFNFIFLYFEFILGIVFANSLINLGILKKQVRFLNNIKLDDF